MKKKKTPKVEALLLTTEAELLRPTNFSLEVHTTRADLAGSALVGEAIGQVQEKKRAEIVRLVQNLLDRLQTLDRILRKATRQRDLTVKQLEAIERGEFRISETELHGFRLHFTDPAIDIDWDSTAHW